jgi:hypothetical protein
MTKKMYFFKIAIWVSKNAELMLISNLNSNRIIEYSPNNHKSIIVIKNLFSLPDVLIVNILSYCMLKAPMY